jgi:tetratricopeptide (TPR) repeat protein
MTSESQAESALPPEAKGHAERLSTQALAIPFVGREQEMATALAHVLPGDEPADGRGLVVHGDSGTGKTFFARVLMLRLSRARPGALYLYIDVANDDYQSSRTIASLLKMSFVPGPLTRTSTVGVPEELSLQRYRRHSKQRGVGRGLLRAIAHAIGGAIGVGTAVSAALDDGEPGGAQVEDELVAYLSWVAKTETAFITIDNIQFLNLDVRLTIESILERVGKNVRLIALDRTVDGNSELSPPVRCFADHLVEMSLANLTPEETMQLVASAIGRDPSSTSRLADDIFTKTNGLAKDVEYCLRQYSLELGRGARAGAIDGLLSTIGRLPVIHREFLVIAALLNGGVNKAIARGTVRRLASIYDNARLDDVVDELVARDYLRLDSETGGRLRPGHERIVIAMRELADEDLHEEVRRSLIEELAAALEAADADEQETYLLHCLVGLQTARELTRNIHYISRLIQSQHRQDQFSYLVALSDELQEILPLLPEHVLSDLLDAMQKSSAFEKGLQVVRLLDTKDVPGAADRKIYRLKYLTQAYRYDDALALSEELGQDEWGAVYRVNALMALDRTDEARAIADASLSSALSECQAVMRRNTITLFDPETALSHLDEAYAYFERAQSDYRLATIDTNRSVVYLHAGRLGDANRSLESSLARMRYVGSREVYQAQVNIALRAALLGDYSSALDTLDNAGLHVPRALLMDQVKINMNRSVIACAGGALTLSECEEALTRCVRRIRGVQMPYLHRALLANIAASRGESAPPTFADPERVSLTVRLPAERSQETQPPWELMMSVHWRY